MTGRRNEEGIMGIDIKKVMAKETVIFFWVTILAMVLTLIYLWPAIYNYCWEIWYMIILPVYGVYFAFGIVRFVLWAIKTKRAK